MTARVMLYRRVDVENSCGRGSPDGEPRRVPGVASTFDRDRLILAPQPDGGASAP